MTDRERHRNEQAQWFGENVRKNRERKQMSQDDLAEAMAARGWPWHQSTVYKVEHGTRRTEAFELHDLAQILGIPMNNLFVPPAELNEAAFVSLSGVRLRRAWEKTAAAARELLAAIAESERTLERHAGSKFGRVHEALGELRADLEERTLDSAFDEGAYRYEHRGDED